MGLRDSSLNVHVQLYLFEIKSLKILRWVESLLSINEFQLQKFYGFKKDPCRGFAVEPNLI